MRASELLKKLPTTINPASIEGVNTLFHFDLSGDGGGQLSLKIVDGKCEVNEGLQGEPKCVVKVKDADLLSIIKGDTNPMAAFFTGKIKVSNQSELLKYAKVLGFM